MSAVKKIFITFFSILLIFSLSLSILFFNMNKAINYENLEKNSLNLFNKYLINNDLLNSRLNEELEFINIYCQQNPNNLSDSSLDYSFNFSDYEIKLSCNNLTDKNNLINESIKSIINKIYFKDYNCSFIDCFNKEQIPFFLASQKTSFFMHKLFLVFLFISLCLLIFIFLLLKNRGNILFFLSVLLFISSFTFLKLIPVIYSFFGEEDLIKEIVIILFFPLKNISNKLIILSLVFFIVGIILLLVRKSKKIGDKFQKNKNENNKEKKFKTENFKKTLKANKKNKEKIIKNNNSPKDF